jgi:hypothetical protein
MLDTKEFSHIQAAHCETGVASNLLRHYGIELSEPMVFGLASGLSFAYLPFVNINGLPLIAYRTPPRLILKMLSWRIKGLKIKFKTFKTEQDGKKYLDKKLAQNIPVGLQTSVYFLPYFPKEMRFHFNAHNLLVFSKSTSKQQDNYHVSDPVFSHLNIVENKDLSQARFSKGALAPKGRLYFLEKIPENINFQKLIPKAIRWTGKFNGRFNPMPLAGVLGMKRVAKKIEDLDKKSPRYQQLFLGHIVRMQEEIGTGGAGFRYMYAAFLQESAVLINQPILKDWADGFISVGDKWREFALLCARNSKKREDAQPLKQVANYLREIASIELKLYNKMAKFKCN